MRRHWPPILVSLRVLEIPNKHSTEFRWHRSRNRILLEMLELLVLIMVLCNDAALCSKCSRVPTYIEDDDWAGKTLSLMLAWQFRAAMEGLTDRVSAASHGRCSTMTAVIALIVSPCKTSIATSLFASWYFYFYFGCTIILYLGLNVSETVLASECSYNCSSTIFVTSPL